MAKKLVIDPVIAAILAAQGIVPEKVQEERATEKDFDDPPQRVMYRGQGTIVSLSHPLERRLAKKCKNCGDPFYVNYSGTAYCSMTCTEIRLKKDFGLSWKPNSRLKKEKWEVLESPEIVPYKALQAMKTLVSFVEETLGQPIEILTLKDNQIQNGQAMVSRMELPEKIEEIELPEKIEKIEEIPAPSDSFSPIDLDDDFLSFLSD